MAGHSKWANIKHKKSKTDAQKGKLFTKLGREIAICVKRGGADPESNEKLRDVISKAKRNNMPNDNIERSIRKAAGDLDTKDYEEVVYEGYGPSGVAVIVEATTDNRNRTAGEVRHAFDKFGGNLGTTGCVSYLFEKKGQILIEKKESLTEDQMMSDGIDAGAEDLFVGEQYYEILTEPASFSMVCRALEAKSYVLEMAEIASLPSTWVKVSDDQHRIYLEKLIDFLEDNEDVQNIYHNWEQE